MGARLLLALVQLHLTAHCVGNPCREASVWERRPILAVGCQGDENKKDPNIPCVDVAGYRFGYAKLSICGTRPVAETTRPWERDEEFSGSRGRESRAINTPPSRNSQCLVRSWHQPCRAVFYVTPSGSPRCSVRLSRAFGSGQQPAAMNWLCCGSRTTVGRRAESTEPRD